MVSLFELCARIPTLRHLPCGFGGLNIKLFRLPPDFIRISSSAMTTYAAVPRLLVCLVCLICLICKSPTTEVCLVISGDG